nr:S8 family serine peptidase [uncultured Glaciecola sp.]
MKKLFKTNRVLSVAVAVALSSTSAFASSPWMWDKDANQIDDRIEAVNNIGLDTAFENSGRLRFAVFPGDITEFGVYVGFENIPTETELAQLRQSGVNVEGMKAYQSIPYVRMTLNFQDIQTVSNLPGVTRVESIPMMYAKNDNANKASGAVASGFERFPTVHANLNITGRDVVVGILDTGVNDEFDLVTLFPGHESFVGKFIAGGEFFAGQAFLNTATDSSENPIDRGERASSNHGSHVAGTAIGSGGDSGVFGGVAPGAKLVDAKVLSDAGIGFGSADGVDWAIVNKEIYDIRVLNLSLGGVDNSDGSDAGSQAINAAFDAGIISVIAAGNDGETNYISSPAAADKAITVGAIADINTIDRADDTIASFSNEGPRIDDGDADNIDEMKPEISAPGFSLISADGSLITDGTRYKSLSGTSMATPHVAGIIALMLEAYPDMTPSEIDATLRHTAEHRFDWGKTDASERPFSSIDRNYHPSGGWGQVDAYAAVKEALFMAGDLQSQTQVVHISATPDEANNSITLFWKSQRETNLIGYDVYRATDVDGAPGVFEQINNSTIVGTGAAVIEKVNNRNQYSIVDTELTIGETYWYRIDHTSINSEVGVVEEPAYPVALGTPKATVALTEQGNSAPESNANVTTLGLL